jgi:hypothetical protein
MGKLDTDFSVLFVGRGRSVNLSKVPILSANMDQSPFL